MQGSISFREAFLWNPNSHLLCFRMRWHELSEWFAKVFLLIRKNWAIIYYITWYEKWNLTDGVYKKVKASFTDKPAVPLQSVDLYGHCWHGRLLWVAALSQPGDTQEVIGSIYVDFFCFILPSVECVLNSILQGNAPLAETRKLIKNGYLDSCLAHNGHKI